MWVNEYIFLPFDPWVSWGIEAMFTAGGVIVLIFGACLGFMLIKRLFARVRRAV